MNGQGGVGGDGGGKKETKGVMPGGLCISVPACVRIEFVKVPMGVEVD
jgi:hypothetical protein